MEWLLGWHQGAAGGTGGRKGGARLRHTARRKVQRVWRAVPLRATADEAPAQGALLTGAPGHPSAPAHKSVTLHADPHTGTSGPPAWSAAAAVLPRPRDASRCSAGACAARRPAHLTTPRPKGRPVPPSARTFCTAASCLCAAARLPTASSSCWCRRSWAAWWAACSSRGKRGGGGGGGGKGGGVDWGVGGQVRRGRGVGEWVGAEVVQR